MDIMQLGAIGELVGGVAVIASLLYVGTQVRESRKAAESANNQAQADAHTAYLTAIASDGILSGAFQKLIHDPLGSEPLTPEESSRMSPLLHTAFTQFQVAFMSYDHGLIRKGLRDHMARALDGWLRAPFVQTWWADQGGMYSSEFRAHVNREIRAQNEREGA